MHGIITQVAQFIAVCTGVKAREKAEVLVMQAVLRNVHRRSGCASARGRRAGLGGAARQRRRRAVGLKLVDDVKRLLE